MCCLSDETPYPTLSLFQVSFQLNLSYSQGPKGGVRWTRNFSGWDFPKVHGQVQPVRLLLGPRASSSRRLTDGVDSRTGLGISCPQLQIPQSSVPRVSSQAWRLPAPASPGSPCGEGVGTLLEPSRVRDSPEALSRLPGPQDCRCQDLLGEAGRAGWAGPQASLQILGLGTTLLGRSLCT